jgi:hypothetical protein
MGAGCEEDDPSATPTDPSDGSEDGDGADTEDTGANDSGESDIYYGDRSQECNDHGDAVNLQVSPIPDENGGNEGYVNSPGEADADVTIEVVGASVVVTDPDAEFNCCLDAWMQARVEGNAIVAVETEDTGSGCLCSCGRSLTVTVPDLAEGSYQVFVYREEEVEENLLAEEMITIGSAADNTLPDGENLQPSVTENSVSDCLNSAAEDDVFGGDPDNIDDETVTIEQAPQIDPSEPDEEIPEDMPDNSQEPYLVTQGDTVTFVDPTAVFNCCLEVTLQVMFEENHITIREKEIMNETGGCWCECPRELTATIGNLSVGTYTIDVFKITATGEETTVGSFSIECLDSPNDWQYDGIVCVD